MQELLKEAFHSYQIYLQCSGVLDVHQAKLSLLLWPDVAHSAIKLAEKPGDESLIMLLRQDLKSCMIEPIRVIHESTAERIKQVTGKFPATPVATMQDDTVFADPCEVKTTMLYSINKMFVTLNTLTDVEYPVLKSKVSHD